ncbi:MAG: metallophosphoesterase family protein [Candidatus Dormibacteraeota bacterium]|nr:metallophosphoesterase family protein [Candidatus Dormibacteraeota bacterium]
MKLAIVSDIHGNLAALEAVVADLDQVRPDRVVHGGDLVLNGPRPAECLAMVRERGWEGVQGNTDQVLWDRASHAVPPGIGPIADWTTERLGAGDLAWLRSQPLEWRDGEAVALVHAVPGDVWGVVPADATDQQLQSTYGSLGARLAVYCHIHVPFVRRAGEGLTVANTGSVGLPFDGDPRAAYLLVEDGTATTRRVPYDLERAVHDLHASGHPAAARVEQNYRRARM